MVNPRILRSATHSTSSLLIIKPECSVVLNFRKSMMISLVYLVLKLRWLSWLWCHVFVADHSYNGGVIGKLDRGVGAMGGNAVMGVQQEQVWT